jgi:class 3 adenylate cyclase/tetratricopeptide (TPR) repeat protein
MNCPNCGTLNPQEARFCFNCGSPLALTCQQCGTSLQPGAKFCHNCGHPVSAGAAPATQDSAPKNASQPQTVDDLVGRYIPRGLLSKLESARSSHLMEGERRVVTILFCDVKGSTEAASGLDPEEWAEIINGAFEYMIQPVYRYEGTVARLQGDGLLAFFGAPIAHEDDPQRAMLAGMEIAQAVHAYGQGIHQRWGIEFEVRVGINTGLVVVGAVGSDLRLEYSALGDAINLAARMEQNAQPGTVLIAEPTYKLVAPLFNFEAIENLQVKGLVEPISAYRVLERKEQPGSLRGITGLNAPLVGRKLQMDALWQAADQLGQGRGQIVSVIGEAGLGKSRLVTEFRRSLISDPELNVQWLEGRALSYETSTPYAPFANLFSRFFNLRAGDPELARFEKVCRYIEELFPRRAEEMAPFIATLLGIRLDDGAAERVRFLQPPQLRGLIFMHVTSLLEGLLAAQPLVIYMDDLHWADPTSLELLMALMPLAERLPVLLITAFRPHRQEGAWRFHELGERDYNHCYRSISLDPLDVSQSRQLVASLLHIEDLPESVRQRILDKAEGNPFFVEEIIRSMLDSGLVVRQDGRWQATREIDRIVLPDTLAGVITARLDRLDEASRRIVQAASVLGREFSAGLLGEIIEERPQLEPVLIELQRRDLVRERSRLPEQVFAFKHVLTQEAAYNSILLSNRRELHRRAGEALAVRDPQAAGEISRHLLEARQAARAVPFLVQAGEKAARAYATQEAIAYFRQAVDLKGSFDDLALLQRAYEGLGGTLTFANRIPEAQELYQEMLAMAEATGSIPMQTSALNKLAGLMALNMGQFTQAEPILDRAESLARQHDEYGSIPETSMLRCKLCTARADFSSVVRYMDEVIKLGKDMGNPAYIAMGAEHVASSMVYMGRFEEAYVKAQEGLRAARQIGDREHEASLLGISLPLIYIRAGDFEAARLSLTQALEISVKIGFSFIQALATYSLSRIAHWRGEYETALEFGGQSLQAGLPLEDFTPFVLVLTLSSQGMVYLDISEKFVDKIADLHLHALRLLERPLGTMTGSTAWADLGHCAIALGDLDLAEQVLQKGLNFPNMFILLERPRQLAGMALLSFARGDFEESALLASEARANAEEYGLRHLYPMTALIQGKVLAARRDYQAALEALDIAKKEAEELGMRPIVWQSDAAAADVLTILGKASQAEEKRQAAQAMVAEIADLFEAQDLRAAFLQNAMSKIPKVA